MSEDAVCPEGSLVLYRNRPARVRSVGVKLEIEREGGEVVRVRPKDVTLLHPGPAPSPGQLSTPWGEIEAAWELLAGEVTNLAELAELAYGAYTPDTAWAACRTVLDELYFQGSLDRIVPRSPDSLARERAERESRSARQQARSAFVARVRSGQVPLEDDAPFLEEVERLALGETGRCDLLHELGRSQTAENAHGLLLELGHWDHTVNPHPVRLRLPLRPPEVRLPDLPDEPRVDLTHLAAYAIDDEGSRDPDDALSIDGSRLWVHIADAAALVSPDSPADLEARARALTLYLPEMTVPMLPPAATAMLGLGLADVSPALSFGLDMDSAGRIQGIELHPSWVRVDRLTYQEAETRLDEEPFSTLHSWAEGYRARRQACGAVNIEFPEVRVRVCDGQVEIRPLEPLRSRVLVQESMVMAGEALARFAVTHSIPVVFSSQGGADVGDVPDGLAGMYALQSRMRRSQLSAGPMPHMGLGLDVYAQGTSSLRRYQDLVMHQQLRAFRRGEALLDEQEVLARVGAAEAMVGIVRKAERVSRRHWTLVYLMQHPGWQGKGVVVRKRGARTIVVIPELGLTGELHLTQDVPLNTELAIAVAHVNLPELVVHWRVVG